MWFWQTINEADAEIRDKREGNVAMWLLLGLVLIANDHCKLTISNENTGGDVEALGE
jgi:hypothetical protein